MVWTWFFEVFSKCIKIVVVYLKELLIDKFILKLVVGLWTGYISAVYIWNEKYIHIICTLFIMNWMLWTIKAIRFRVFNHDRFFQWIYKIVAIWILLYIWYAVDTVLPYDFLFMWIMFAFIALNDVSHIVQHLEDLWFRIVPSWFIRAIQIHKNQYVIDRIKSATWYDISNKYLEDLNQIEAYINNIPDLSIRKLSQIELVYLRRIIMNLIDTEIKDLLTYRMKLNLLFHKIWWELETAIKTSWEPEDKIKIFCDFNKERYEISMWDIENIIDWSESKLLNNEQLRQIKENILQTIIRMVYRNVSDKYNLKN